MQFNFPNKEERVLINIKLTKAIFLKIKDIAEREECLRAETIIVLLEGAIQEYYRQGNTPQDTAYPAPAAKESNPDEEDKLNEFGHKVVGWSYAYDKCVSCGTTERKHLGKGLCSRCYYKKDVSQKEPDPVRENQSVCQLSFCQKSIPKGKEIIEKGNYVNLVFCSQKCLKDWKNLDRTEEYSLISSNPIYDN